MRQYCKINNGCFLITKEEAETNKTDNIYYLDNCPEWLNKRAKDEDIKEKDYFVLDLDLYNNIEAIHWEELSIEDIKSYWEFFKDWLEENEYFREWSKIVFSGRGIHIYYYWKLQQFEKEEYASWVERIYRQWDKYMESPKYYCDHQCKNLARILRLPWSVNQKNGATVEVLYEQKIESRLVNGIKWLAKKELLEKEAEAEKNRIEAEARIKSYGDGWDNLYKKINAIKAYDIAQALVPDFPYDGKKNFKNKKWGFTWYYYVEPTNTIANGGSRYFDFWNANSCFNNFSLMKHFNNWTDHETFIFFKDKLWIK